MTNLSTNLSSKLANTLIGRILSTALLSITLSSMSIYDISFEDSRSGKQINLSDYRGKVIMVVNTASLCGFTKQYSQMEALWKEYKDRGFILIAVPTNDFGGQEPKGDHDIVKFCEVNFGIDFPIAKKVTSKGENVHPFFKLTKQDFGTMSGPYWNFYKYVYGTDGKPLTWYSSIRSPHSSWVKSLLNKNLPHEKD